MRTLIVAFCIGAACQSGAAQRSTWQPVPGRSHMPRWPGLAPNTRPAPDSESLTTHTKLVAGKPWSYVRNVSRPTLTVYSPIGNNTGAAVVVFPGGGYQILAIDLEGTEVCDWLTSRGITCVLLKYRVPNDGPNWDQHCGCDSTTQSSMPLEDAQRALGLVRLHAAEWHIDPHKVGVLGFSAGGHMVATVSTHFDHRVYAPVDAADQESCRPDFAVALYPGHLFDYGVGAVLGHPHQRADAADVHRPRRERQRGWRQQFAGLLRRAEERPRSGRNAPVRRGTA